MVNSSRTSRGCFHFVGLLPLGQPGPEDVARRIHVCVVGMPTSPTSKHGSDATGPINGVALGASLRGVTGVDPNELPASIFRFVGEHSVENPPSRVEDGTVQGRLGGGSIGVVSSLVVKARRRATGQIGDPEIFDHDRVIVIYQLTREFVEEIPPLIADFAMYPGNCLSRHPRTSRSPTFLIEVPLSSGEPSSGPGKEPWILHRQAIRRRRDGGDASIQANLSTRRRKGLRRNVGAENGDPPPPPLTSQRAGFGYASKLAVNAYLDVPYSLHVEAFGRRVEAPTRAVPPLYGIPAPLPAKSRESGSLPTAASSVEGLECFVQTDQSPPAHRHTPRQDIRPHRPKTGQGPVLLITGYPTTLPTPCATAFFQCCVVQLALRGQQRLEARRLSRRRLKQVAECSIAHSLTITRRCDIHLGQEVRHEL